MPSLTALLRLPCEIRVGLGLAELTQPLAVHLSSGHAATLSVRPLLAIFV